MPRNFLETSTGADAFALAVSANDRVYVNAAGRDVGLELYTTGGGAVVAIQSRNVAGIWETLTLDDGATAVTLTAGTPTTVQISLPVETLGVLVSSVTGTPLMTAAIVTRELY